jgi:hypothetical protein
MQKQRRSGKNQGARQKAGGGQVNSRGARPYGAPRRYGPD